MKRFTSKRAYQRTPKVELRRRLCGVCDSFEVRLHFNRRRNPHSHAFELDEIKSFGELIVALVCYLVSQSSCSKSEFLNPNFNNSDTRHTNLVKKNLEQDNTTSTSFRCAVLLQQLTRLDAMGWAALSTFALRLTSARPGQSSVVVANVYLCTHFVRNWTGTYTQRVRWMLWQSTEHGEDLCRSCLWI